MVMLFTGRCIVHFGHGFRGSERPGQRGLYGGSRMCRQGVRQHWQTSVDTRRRRKRVFY